MVCGSYWTGREHRVRVAQSPPRMGMGLRASIAVVVLVLAGGSSPAPKSWDPMAEEKSSCLLEAGEAHPEAGTGRALGRKEGWGCPGSARPQRSGRRAVPSLEGSPGDPRGPQHPGLTCSPRFCAPRPPARTGAAAGRDSKMKLWDVVAVCLVLLHTASAFPLPAGKRPPEAPAEDRSLGRRRAPFALSSDCKNRSLPARVTPPAARTHPRVSPAAERPPREEPRGRRSPLPLRRRQLVPKAATPSLCMARAGFAQHRG